MGINVMFSLAGPYTADTAESVPIRQWRQEAKGKDGAGIYAHSY